MGQLEKYGLYVLCLVIFLILGVALWGEPASAQESATKGAIAPKQNAASAPTTGEIPLRDLLANAARPDGGAAESGGGGRGGKDGAKERDAKDRDAKSAAERDAGKDTARQSPAADKGEPKAAAKADARGSHKIVAGDTLEGIAKGLGDARLVPLLVQLNPGITPEKMRVGKSLVLPTTAEIEALRSKNAPPAEKPAEKPADKPTDRAKDHPADKAGDKAGDKATAKTAATGRTHRIEKGDTLEGLAVRYFGSSKRLDDIKALNPSVDPTRLRIGQIIKLPD